MKPHRQIFIALTLSFLAFGAAGADGTAKTPNPAVTLVQARQTAQAAVPDGKIKSGEYENEAGQWVYSFDIATKAGIREVWVDSQTGKIVKNEADTPAPE